MDQFCSEHKQLTCSLCSSTGHKNCATGNIRDVCKSIPASEIDVLCDDVKIVLKQA